MLPTQITRQSNLPFKIDAVKNAIKQVIANRNTKYRIDNANDLMGIYRITLIGGMMVIIPVSIQLNSINDNETKLELQSTRAVNSINQGNQIVDDFLNYLSNELGGKSESVQSDAISKPKSKSKWIYYIIGWILLCILFYVIKGSK